MNEEIKTLVLVDDDENFIADLTNSETSFCSLKSESREEKAVLFKVMNNPEKRLSECVNTTINAKDVFVEMVNCVQKQTGETQKCARIVIVDDKGTGYQAVSIGVFNALKKLIKVYGSPTWEEPIPIKPITITKGELKILSLDIAIS